MSFVGEPFGVGRMRKHRRRQMRPPHRLPPRLARLDRGRVDLEAELAQAGGHRVRSPLAVRPRVE
jgi:hypothetical protein